MGAGSVVGRRRGAGFDLPGCGYEVGLALLGESDRLQGSRISVVFSVGATLGTKCVIGSFRAGPHIIKITRKF